jgi:hypothetical protein
MPFLCSLFTKGKQPAISDAASLVLNKQRLYLFCLRGDDEI